MSTKISFELVKKLLWDADGVEVNGVSQEVYFYEEEDYFFFGDPEDDDSDNRFFKEDAFTLEGGVICAEKSTGFVAKIALLKKEAVEVISYDQLLEIFKDCDGAILDDGKKIGSVFYDTQDFFIGDIQSLDEEDKKYFYRSDTFLLKDGVVYVEQEGVTHSIAFLYKRPVTL